MILVIIGTSSAGKSTISKILQKQLGDGWLYFSMDDYLGMLGPKFSELNHNNPNVLIPNDICYAKKHGDGSYEVITGPLCTKLYNTIPAQLTLLASRGFNIVVDTFITTVDEFNSYKKLQTEYSVLFVYLHASLEVISKRESFRGDRLLGSGQHWLKLSECENLCDLSYDTSGENPEDIAIHIVNEIINK